MPYRLFHNSQYDADMVHLMSKIFDEVCNELRLANREDRLRDLIAYEIMECFEQGKRDPNGIRQCVRKALHLPGPANTTSSDT
jgi:hypothetical protein